MCTNHTLVDQNPSTAYKKQSGLQDRKFNAEIEPDDYNLYR